MNLMGGRINIPIFTSTLATGYKVDPMDEEANRLKRICDEAVIHKDFLPHVMILHGNTWTFCNKAANYIAWRFASYLDFELKLANDIITLMEERPEWVKVERGIWASEYARSGGLAFAVQRAKNHGHIAAIYPTKDGYSAKWHKRTPYVANVGRKNGVMRCSEAFKIEPEYYVFKKENVKKKTGEVGK
jgi:hypothetical protein